MTGNFFGTASFGSTSLVAPGSNNYYADVFVAKFGAADGTCAWAVRAGGSSADAGYGIAVDGGGNAVVTGTFSGTASFGTSPAATSLVAASFGSSDVFVAKFESGTGTCAWAVRAGGTGADVGYGVAVDGNNNPLVTGDFQGIASFAAPADANTIPSTPGGISRFSGVGVFAVRLAGSTGAWEKPAQANGGGTSTGRATATDAAGNQYVTGEFSGNLVLGGTTLVSAGISDVFVAKRSAGGIWLWAARAGGVGNDAGYGIAVDGSGNVLVTGGYRGTASFATAPTATSLVSANGNYSDVFVAKFRAADGGCAWVLRAGVNNTGGDAAGYGVAVDGSGNAVVTGCILGTVSFAPVSTATTLVANIYNKTVFVAKFGGADGACAWAVKTGGSSIGTGSGIALDGSGNALVTGNFLGTASFATAPTATSLVSATGNYGNYNDVFVAKFGAADGTCAWAVKAGGNSEDMGSGIAVDGSGNALVTGAFSSTATFAAPTTAISLATTGGKDVFVAKFGAADGTCAWAVKAGSSDSDAGYGIALDGGGNALVTGGFQGTASFGTAPTATSLVVAGSNSNSTDVFVAKFGAANGACAWAVRAGGTWTDAGYGIAADGSGNVLITGDFQGTAVFGSTTLVGGAAVRAGYDPSGFVATLAVPATPAPVLTSVSPAAELPGQVVTLTGTGFNSGSIVSFGGVAAAGVSYVSATSVTAVVPVGAGSTVSVATALGTTAAQPFTLLSPADNRTLPAGICTSATPVTLGADSNWHYLLVGGQVALAYNTQGLNLGTVSAELLRADPAAPVRTDGMGRAYLGRNWHLTTSAGLFTGSTVRVRFYALSSEFNQLSAADPANVPNLAALRLTQYSGPNEDCDLTNDAAGAGRRLLTPTTTNGPAGSNFFVSEVAVADHFSEFYLNGGAAPLPVRAATLSGAADGLALYPNPASTGATLTGGQPGTLITVFDPLGRLVATATADATGTAKLALPAGLPAGIYVVHAGPQAVRLTVE